MAKKTDNDTVSAEEYELAHISYFHRIPKKEVAAAKKKVGASREKIYAELRSQGWTIEDGRKVGPESRGKVKKISNCILLPDPTRKLPLFKPGKGRKPPKPIKPTPTPVPTDPTEPVPTPTPVPIGAIACLYFNFKGRTVQHPSWNGGQAFVCAPANMTAEQQAATMARVQIAYGKYNVAITDDEAVYKSALVRQEIIVTQSSAWYPNTGFSGVTYTGSLWGTPECPCFVFADRLATNVQYVGAIMVHEAGHAVGLSHQRTHNEADCAIINQYKLGANMGNALYVANGEWITQPCSTQYDDKFLIQKLGLR